MIHKDPDKHDNGGRRFEKDRRVYSYTRHLPEKRSGKNRRGGHDRREEKRNGSIPET